MALHLVLWRLLPIPWIYIYCKCTSSKAVANKAAPTEKEVTALYSKPKITPRRLALLVITLLATAINVFGVLAEDRPHSALGYTLLQG